ncbi:Na+/H+ antiporter [Actinomadura rupiterrae]|uniref:Na+/H+ antiporter n=1 Tax=Actinomadura rupiterrae TaxID=559627 RepID=UPI0020A5D4FB|nr:Na+/H+ antiporter [Actinomadura rupiterrae]MCP2340785.1 CPA1 family monovalent cation:H+ antiporter [Actinomadura rupiterrae]
MGEDRLFIVLLVVAIVVLLARALARRLGVPDAILLVVLGIAAGFMPGLPTVTVSPRVVLLGFLPPLVYHAAFFSAPRETRTNAVPIFALAVGLTLVTTAAVAGTAYVLLPGTGWPAAIALGAAVAPTDAVAATSVMQRLGAAPRLVTILEGESLINDGVALTVFGLAVEAINAPFTVGHGVVRLVQVVVGGVAYGLAVGLVVRRVRRWISDPSSQIIVSLITPYIAYVPAESLGASGVLAAVVSGFYLGTHGEGLLQPASRLLGMTFWRILTFLLESALFVLLGLEIRELLHQPGGKSWWDVAWIALAVSVVVIGVRVVWELGNGPIADLLPGGRQSQEGVGWRQRLVVGLAGMRGAISLAIALSIPAAAGPDRELMVLLTALVVLVTLVGQAPLLPVLLRRFGLVETDRRRREAMTARQAAANAALVRLDEMASADEVDERTADTFRQMLELRLERVEYFLDEMDEDGGEGEGRREDRGEPPGSQRVRAELVRAQRAKLNTLYRKGKIGAATVRQVGNELDFAEPVSLRRPT